MKVQCIALALMLCTGVMAQENHTNELPYEEIPAAPESYIAGNILTRLIDGLGYRYYWATEGLTESDLLYAPSKEARTSRQTLEHLYGLSETIVNATTNTANIRPQDWSTLTFEQLRRQTLLHLQEASKNCAGRSEEEIANFKVKFDSKGRQSEFPYWNMINGPIADALYHVGQIVSFRRSSGNPIHPGVSVFTGKTRQK